MPHAVEKESLETCTDGIIPSQKPSITWQIMATKTWHMTLNANFSQILETYVSIMSSIKQNAEAFTDKRPLLQIQRYTVTVKLTSTCHRPWPIASHSQKWLPNIIQSFFYAFGLNVYLLKLHCTPIKVRATQEKLGLFCNITSCFAW